MNEAVSWERFEQLRKGSTVALHCLANLLRYFEEDNWMDDTDAYHDCMKAIAELAKGLRGATEP